MSTKALLIENIFKTIEEQMSFEQFESWLYGSEELLNGISEDEIILEAYTFNYRRRDLRSAFKQTFIKYFDLDEFLLWKVKANLADLIARRNNRDRILSDLYRLSNDGYFFLQNIGYYVYQIEDFQYYGNDLEDVLKNLARDCEDL